MKKKGILLIICIILSGCTTPLAVSYPTQTSSQPITTPTLEPVIIYTPSPEENLALDSWWRCGWNPIETTQSGLTIQTSDGWYTPVNMYGRHIEFVDSFTLYFHLTTTNTTFGGIALFGVLPTNEGIQRTTNLSVGLENGMLSITRFHPSILPEERNLSFSTGSPVMDALIIIEKKASTISIFADGVFITSIQDPGFFPENKAYLGANAGPDNTVSLPEIWVDPIQIASGGVELVSPMRSRLNNHNSQDTLRNLAQSEGLFIGSAAAPYYLLEDDYAQTLAQQFNILTTEDGLTFGPVHPAQDVYNFCYNDILMSFAQANEMKVVGHSLVYDYQIPAWVTDTERTREQWIDLLHDHIQTLMSYYQGKFYAVNVVNEAFNEDGTLKNTFWYRTIGPDYIKLAFQWAHEADPNVRLIYNDFNLWYPGPKFDAVYRMVNEMQIQGIPIDGIGFQIYATPEQDPYLDGLSDNIDRLAALNLRVYFTEVAVSLRNTQGSWSVRLEKQAVTYQHILSICQSNPACEAFISWGFTDRYLWNIQEDNGGLEIPLIFDEMFRPKPVFFTLQSQLGNSVYADSGILLTPPKITTTRQDSYPLTVTSSPPDCQEVDQTWFSPQDSMTMICIPSGEFEMGISSDDNRVEQDEYPLHSVYLDAYWIDQTEVTNFMYKSCVDSGFCSEPTLYRDRMPEYFQSTNYEDYPAVMVSWDQAQTYCEWAGRTLPTEAQWEKAARGNDGRLFPWGNQNPTSSLANYSGLHSNSNIYEIFSSYGEPNTFPVGSFPSGISPYGALDMAGNVWEWVADWFDPNFYSYSPLSNPLGSDNIGLRVFRGGGWNSEPWILRSTNRGWASWGFSELLLYKVYVGSTTIGFRCAIDSP